MTQAREEQIHKEALESYPVCEVMQNGMLVDVNSVLRQSYETGAMWADQNPVNQWHKVKDELPPTDSVTNLSNILAIAISKKRWFKGLYDSHNKRWLRVVDDGVVPVTWDVKGWMELPELPKDE